MMAIFWDNGSVPSALRWSLSVEWNASRALSTGLPDFSWNEKLDTSKMKRIDVVWKDWKTYNLFADTEAWVFRFWDGTVVGNRDFWNIWIDPNKYKLPGSNVDVLSLRDVQVSSATQPSIIPATPGISPADKIASAQSTIAAAGRVAGKLGVSWAPLVGATASKALWGAYGVAESINQIPNIVNRAKIFAKTYNQERKTQATMGELNARNAIKKGFMRAFSAPDKTLFWKSPGV